MATFIVDSGFTAKTIQVIPPVVNTTAGATNGTAFYIGDVTGPLNLYISLGAASGTSATMDVKLQEADAASGATWTDIPSSSITTMTDTSDNTINTAFVKSALKPYIRAVTTLGGTTPSFAVSGMLIAQKRQAGSAAGFSISPS